MTAGRSGHSVRILTHMLRLTVAVGLAALSSAGAASASCGGGQVNPVTVASGTWSGLSWKLQAIDSGDGRYGMTAFVAGSRRARLSGPFYVPGRNGAPVNFGWTASTPGTKPAFVAGAITEAARKITVGLSNGAVRTVRTIPPRCLLAPGISFFVATIPRGTHPTFFTARSAAGVIVASWRR
jgi:hypothetical protein